MPHTLRLTRSNTLARYVHEAAVTSLKGGSRNHSSAGCGNANPAATLTDMNPPARANCVEDLASEAGTGGNVGEPGGVVHDMPLEIQLESRRRSRLRAALMTAAILAAGVAVAACGGPSTPGVVTDSTATTTTTTTASSSIGAGAQATGLVAYAACMRSHGVPNFPDPGGKGGIPKPALITALKDVSSSQAQTAQNDCKDVLPAGGLSGQPVQTIPVGDQRDYLRAVACLRAHGITDFPDPVFSGGGVHFSIPASINTNSTQFIQAQQICEKLIPAGLPDSGSRS
jgi:hypothetical protein